MQRLSGLLCVGMDTASFVQSISVPDDKTMGLFFSPDGSKFLTLNDSNEIIREYSLSTAYDLSTRSQVRTWDITSITSTPRNFTFSEDGLNIYIVDTGGGDRVIQYSLSAPYNIGSPQTLVGTFGVRTPLGSDPSGIAFKPDGLKMYMVGTTDFVYEFDLSTPWDITTASYNGNNSDLAPIADPRAIVFCPTGERFWTVSTTNDNISQFVLSTAWDGSTAAFDKTIVGVGAQTTWPFGLAIDFEGKKMYHGSFVFDKLIWEYDFTTL